MSISLNDITKLQAAVKEDLAKGAPGRRGPMGGCCAAPVVDHIKPKQADHVRIKLPPPKPCVKGLEQFQQDLFGAMQALQAQNKRTVRVDTEEKVQLPKGQIIGYSRKSIIKLVQEDLRKRGVDPDTMFIRDIDGGGMLCEPTQ